MKPTHAPPDQAGKYELDDGGFQIPRFRDFWPEKEPCHGVRPDMRDIWMAIVAANVTLQESSAVIAVTRRVMEILVDEPGDFDPYQLILRAQDDILSGDLSKNAMDSAAHWVSSMAIRGDQFEKLYKDLRWQVERQEEDRRSGLASMNVHDVVQPVLFAFGWNHLEVNLWVAAHRDAQQDRVPSATRLKQWIRAAARHISQHYDGSIWD